MLAKIYLRPRCRLGRLHSFRSSNELVHFLRNQKRTKTKTNSTIVVEAINCLPSVLSTVTTVTLLHSPRTTPLFKQSIESNNIISTRTIQRRHRRRKSSYTNIPKVIQYTPEYYDSVSLPVDDNTGCSREDMFPKCFLTKIESNFHAFCLANPVLVNATAEIP
jgi:hypothetical protein